MKKMTDPSSARRADDGLAILLSLFVSLGLLPPLWAVLSQLV